MGILKSLNLIKLDLGCVTISEYYIDTRTLEDWISINDFIHLTFMSGEVLNIRFTTQTDLNRAWENLGNALEETGHFNG